MGWHPDIYSLLGDLKKNEKENSLIYDLFNLIGQNMTHVFNFKNSDFMM